MREDRNGLQVLERDECLALLASATVGRIGLVTEDGAPLVLPVNFCLADDRILLLTTEGTKLDAARHGSAVAFEVDDFDPVYHSGWSVVVRGTAHQLPDDDRATLLRSMPLARWARQGSCHVVEVRIDEVSGRRIR